MQTFDAIVIGSGQAGTCTNDGCTPTKALIASARRAHTVRLSAELGVHSGSCEIDFAMIVERKNRIVSSFREAADYNDHLVMLKNILHGANASIKDRPVPYTMFTDPQLGRVGLSEEQARSQGHNILVATLPMEKTARGIETAETKGLMKAVVDADTKQILGAAILAAEGGEVMTVLQMAMAGKIPYDAVREMIIAHPLYAESLNNLFMTLDA